MYRDFIVKQTSDFNSEYKAKTLVGNWYEERCDPQRQENFHFFKERKLQNDSTKPTLTQVDDCDTVVKFSAIEIKLAKFPKHEPQ